LKAFIVMTWYGGLIWSLISLVKICGCC